MADIDASWIETLEVLIWRLKDAWVKVYLTSLRVWLINKLWNAGFLDNFPKKRIYWKIIKAVDHIEDKYWKEIDIDAKALEEYIPKKKKSKESIWENTVDKFLKK